MSNLLQPAPVSVTKFMWYAPERRFVAEVSDLGTRPFGQVYRDACDEGLTLVSRFASKPDVVLVVNHTEVRDGDLLWWDLVPTSQTGPVRNPEFTVRVYND